VCARRYRTAFRRKEEHQARLKEQKEREKEEKERETT
jgi:hypothetical protein